MRCHITRMRYHGKAYEQNAIRSAPSITGDIILSSERPELLGRGSDVATVKAEGGSHEKAIPSLYDCRLSSMGTNGFVLSGVEFEGSIGYAQSWWCRPV